MLRWRHPLLLLTWLYLKGLTTPLCIGPCTVGKGQASLNYRSLRLAR